MRLVEKTHQMNAFYKYMTADVAEIVLQNRTLRWSSPKLFNDPFDVPRELAVGVEKNEIRKELASLILSFFRSSDKAPAGLSQKLQLLISAIQSTRKDGLIDLIEDDLTKMLEAESFSSSSLEVFNEYWKKILDDMRILCLCESHETTSMWYHYADKYSGVVIQFFCDDNSDSPWRIAKPIEYTNENHLVSTAKGWASLLVLDHEPALLKSFDVSAHTKSEDWSYEKEWRIASFKRPGEEGFFSDYGFDGKSIGNIYLGPLIENNMKSRIVDASKKHENARVYNSEITVGRKILFHPEQG